MVFTANYRAFGQKMSQLSEYATTVIFNDEEAFNSLSLTHAQLMSLAQNGKYFVNTDRKAKKYSIYHLLIHSGINRIADFT
jgi:hypothetical protein